MNPSQNGGESFTIVLSTSIREDIESAQEAAFFQGMGEAFVHALQDIVGRLKTSARTAGEAQYELSAMKLQVRQVAVRPVVVHYAVSDERPVVYIKGVSLMSV